MGNAKKLRRVTDLFLEGKVIVFEGPDGPVTVWVQKPNAFHRQEMNRDGIFGQARMVSTLDDEHEEIVALRREAAARGKDVVIDQAVNQRGYEFMRLARQDVEADPEWQERLPLIDRSGLLDEGSTMTDEEREALVRINGEYIDAVNAAAIKRREEVRAEMSMLSEQDVLDAYVEEYRKLRGMDGFNVEYELTETFYALRDCDAVLKGDEWDHTKCTHLTLLDSRKQVRDLPDPLLTQVRQTLREIQATPDEAGNSGAPSTSSGSSEQPRSAEDSTASTPEATSPEPAGT